MKNQQENCVLIFFLKSIKQTLLLDMQQFFWLSLSGVIMVIILKMKHWGQCVEWNASNDEGSLGF